MHTNLPIISSAGLFRSQDKFWDPKKYPQDSVTRLRTALDYELELFTEDGGVSYLNGKQYPIRKGDVIIAKPGDKRQSRLHFSALYLHFGTTDPAIQELIGTISGFHSDMDYNKLEPLIADIYARVMSFEPDSDLLAACKLIDLLCTIRRDCTYINGQLFAPNKSSAISSAIEYMKQNYANHLTIRDVARYCNLSTSYFHKLFLESVHKTPNQYFLGIKLAAAKSMLVTSNCSMSEVSERCGFNSQSYFCYCFNREFGISPSEFRKSFSYPNEG